MNNEILVKETTIVGTDVRVVLHSVDGTRWYSDRRDVDRYEHRRAAEGKKLKGAARRETTLERL